MSNCNLLKRLRCPNCGSFGPFEIEVKMLVTVTDQSWEVPDTYDPGWDRESYCVCPNCDLAATVADFDEARYEPPIFYANAYRLRQMYGGPEAGGWYYDAGEPLESICLGSNPSDAERDGARTRLTEKYANFIAGQNGNPEYSSVLSNGDLMVCVEPHPAEAFPQTRPRYE